MQITHSHFQLNSLNNWVAARTTGGQIEGGVGIVFFCSFDKVAMETQQKSTQTELVNGWKCPCVCTHTAVPGDLILN